MINSALLQPVLGTHRGFRTLAASLMSFSLPGVVAAASLQLQFAPPSSFNESNRQAVLEWSAEPGRTYVIQSSDEISTTTLWHNADVAGKNAVGPIRWMAPEAVATQKYYRLVLPQPQVFAVEPSFVDANDTNAFLYLLGQALPTNALVEISGRLFTAVAADTNGNSLRITNLNGLPPGQPILGNIRVLNPANSNLITEWSVQTPLVYGPEPTLEQLQGPPAEPPASPAAMMALWASKKGYDYYKAQSDMAAAGAHTNPYFTENTLAGEVPSSERRGTGHVTVLKAHGDDDCDGVVEATGEFRAQETDLAIPGVGLDFAWTRTYRSRTGPTTAQGAGWDFAYNVSLTSQSDGTVLLRTGDGRVNTFYARGTNGWFRDEFFVTIGDLDDDGVADRVTFPDTGKWIFHPPGTAAAGKLAQIVDRNNNAIALHYDVAGRLAEIVDPLNRTNLVAYNAVGQIESVTDFSGRTVRYEYDGHGDLVACISPAVIGTPTGNDFPGGRTNRYTYSSGNADARLNHNLTSCIDAKGQTWLELVYFTTNNPASRDFDAVATALRGIDKKDIRRGMVIAKPGSITPHLQVIENDYLGNVTESYYDSRFRLREVREFTGRANPTLPTTATENRPTGKLRPEDPDYFSTTFDWNNDSLCTRVGYPDGSSTEVVYESAFNQNSSRSNHTKQHDGDVRVIRTRPCCDTDDDGDGVPDSLVMTFEYDLRFGSSGATGGTRVQDHNSSRSNKSSRSASVQDHNSSRSNKSSSLVDDGDNTPIIKGSALGRSTKTYQNQKDSDVASRKGWDGTVKGSTHRAMGAKAKAWMVNNFTDSSRKGWDGTVKGSTKWNDEDCDNFVTRFTDPRGAVTTAEYDSQGNCTKSIKQGHYAVSNFQVEINGTFNSRGQLTAITNAPDANGLRRIDTFTYHASGPQAGYLAAIAIDEPGVRRITAFEYDPRGNVTRVVDPRGNDWARTYNALDECIRVETPTNLTARCRTDFSYDANGNVVQRSAELRDENDTFVRQVIRLAEYDFLDRCTALAEQVSAAGFVTNKFFFDANDNLVAAHSPLAVSGADLFAIAHFEYDERGLLFRKSAAPGASAGITNQFDYDVNGRSSSIKIEISAAGPKSREFYSYDGFGRPVTFVDAMSNTISCTYDRNGNLTRRIVAGELNDTPNATGNIRLAEQTWTYDALDRCIESRRLFFNPAAQKPIGDGAGVTLFAYAPNGACTNVTDDNGHITRFAYDTAGRFASTTDAKNNVLAFTYDAANNVTAMVATERSDLSAGSSQFFRTYTYDALGRCVSTVDNVGNTNACAYDSLGRITRSTDPKGNVSWTAFDDLGRCILTLDDLDGDGIPDLAADVNTSFSYDDNSRCLSVTDDNTNTTYYAYDSRDRVVSQTHADGTVCSLIWSPRSNLLRLQDPNGNVISNRFDLLDRLTERDITPGPGVAATTTFERYAYDGLSQLVAATNDASYSEFAHDSLGHRTHVVTDGWQMLGAYDATDNRLTLTYPSGLVVSNSYDALNQLMTVSSIAGGLPPVLRATFEYEGPGRLGRITRGNNVNTRYQWDGAVSPPNAQGDFGWRQVAGINHQISGGGAVIDRRVATFDRNQNRTRRAQTTPFFGGGPTTTNLFAYDALDRLTQFTRAAGGPDDLFRSYSLDGNGNRTLGISNGVAAPYVMDRTFPDPADFQMNQYTFTPFVLAPEQYDSNGNLIGRVTASAQLGYQYDYANRLVAVADVSGGLPAAVASYNYDALGRRISKTIYPSGLPPVTTQFVYAMPDDDCDGDIIEEYRGGLLMVSSVSSLAGAGGGAAAASYAATGRMAPPIVTLSAAGEATYLHTDELGNVLALTDAGGNVIERCDYDDHGLPIFLSTDGFPTGEIESGVGNRYLFLGMEWDAETGFYRGAAGNYFDPQSGQKLGGVINGGMPNRISMNVTVPKQTQGATFGEKVNAGLQAAGSAVAPGAYFNPREYTISRLKEEGGRHTPFHNKYRPQYAAGKLSRNILKTFFETGDKPTQAQFGAMLDLMLNLQDDRELGGGPNSQARCSCGCGRKYRKTGHVTILK